MNTQRTSIPQVIAVCALGLVAGFILITLPSILRGEHFSSLLALASSSVKNMSVAHLLLLPVGGFVWGLALKWPYSFWATVCQIASLPVITLAEILRDPTSHNLWPFEFLFYVGLALVSLVGLGVALLIKLVVKKREQPEKS